MKLTTDLIFLRAAHPDLFGCTVSEGLIATSEVVHELEVLLAGAKKLRKSYVMRALRVTDSAPTADYTSKGKTAAMARFAETLRTGVYVPRNRQSAAGHGAEHDAPDATLFGVPVLKEEPVRDLPPDPDMDAMLDKYLGDD
jgi:hypothetical protein